MPIIRFYFHPAYGLPDDLRERAVIYSYVHTAKDAAAHYDVGLTTIYVWRKAFVHNLMRNTPLGERRAYLEELQRQGAHTSRILGG